ncbi:transglutaminase-like cysteine peptidase [Bradyrhizobium sp. BR13661]|uniref:transglutaminase-like cysteine peptidase n=1 Tax=Bradyrhizobium sp. BR13661 TaxID=2940622 RepID=UPI0024749DAB|nr:transglutaminase-like cysteine peptidase [Bradyrhizobium sp. BR13661]MDH6263506.1 putative transglutaminase-like cysteine proteinase [Bradyrhizobium sp. BR13661]
MLPFRSILFAIAAALSITGLQAREQLPPGWISAAPIVEGKPTLAPFQHVRFCIRYPSECDAGTSGSDKIELNSKTLEVLKRVNRDVNTLISPIAKDYGVALQDGWTIAPTAGDCNDYAVTKRHQLVENGIPSGAARLAVVKTPSGIGHLVLIVSTTQGDLVLDNLTDAVRIWQSTPYSWIKIQSANNLRFWSEVKPTQSILSDASRVRVANR